VTERLDLGGGHIAEHARMMIVWVRRRISVTASTGSLPSTNDRQRSSISSVARVTTEANRACWPS